MSSVVPLIPNKGSRTTQMLEVCVDSVESAEAAATGGADRIELCSSLVQGGLTPSVGLLEVVKKRINIPVYCMVRPRGGPMVYSEAEKEVILRDATVLRDAGADGLVFGALTAESRIDKELASRFIKVSCGLPCTYHRAFDLVEDPLIALQDVINLGFSRILTSGCRANAIEGVEMIMHLIEHSKSEIIIMAGAGIKSTNVEKLLQKGIKEFHASAKICRKFAYGQGSGAKMGSGDDNELWVTSEEEVAAINKCIVGYK
ncbi:copper homeostasis protein cutC homolog isoform X2 [Oratosquilla oratoria]|uniref:copper homeostasis protein cutC homolog isoform X2 n=1 Tax=Oratosquilla oratoria TaxID=337810 RepID=UPI003F758DFE